MKHIYLYLILIIFIGCKKSDSAIAVDSLQGKWEIRAVQAGMTPTINHQPGNGHFLVFDNGQYQEIQGGTVIGTGTFKVRTESTSIDGCPGSSPQPEMTRMLWSPAVGGREPFFYFESNRLKFISGCFALDGGIYSEWEKVQ